METSVLLSRRQVAKKLNVTYRTLRYQEKKGRFQTIRRPTPRGESCVFYNEDEFRKAQIFYGVLDFNYKTDAGHIT